jgi:hypothetical protein
LALAESDIIYVNALGQSLVIIDNYETAIEILDKRSGICSSRLAIPLLLELSDVNRESHQSLSPTSSAHNWVEQLSCGITVWCAVLFRDIASIMSTYIRGGLGELWFVMQVCILSDSYSDKQFRFSIGEDTDGFLFRS